MSWRDERVDQSKGANNCETEIVQFERYIPGVGVRHKDIRPANMLWSQEYERIMFIDLERAVQIGRTPPQELPANRKRRRSTIALKSEVID